MRAKAQVLLLFPILFLGACSGGESNRDTTSITASAGEDITSAPTGESVQLDGSGSVDSESRTINFQWSFASKPEASAAVLANETTESASFIPDVEGEYTVQLDVDNGIQSDTDFVAVSSCANCPPTASNFGGVDQDQRLVVDVDFCSPQSNDDGSTATPLTDRDGDSIVVEILSMEQAESFCYDGLTDRCTSNSTDSIDADKKSCAGQIRAQEDNANANVSIVFKGVDALGNEGNTASAAFPNMNGE